MGAQPREGLRGAESGPLAKAGVRRKQDLELRVSVLCTIPKSSVYVKIYLGLNPKETVEL